MHAVIATHLSYGSVREVLGGLNLSGAEITLLKRTAYTKAKRWVIGDNTVQLSRSQCEIIDAALTGISRNDPEDMGMLAQFS